MPAFSLLRLSSRYLCPTASVSASGSFTFFSLSHFSTLLHTIHDGRHLRFFELPKKFCLPSCLYLFLWICLLVSRSNHLYISVCLWLSHFVKSVTWVVNQSVSQSASLSICAFFLCLCVRACQACKLSLGLICPSLFSRHDILVFLSACLPSVFICFTVYPFSFHSLINSPTNSVTHSLSSLLPLFVFNIFSVLY